MKRNRSWLVTVLAGAFVVAVMMACPTFAQGPDAKPKSKIAERAVRTIKVANLTRKEAEAKVSEMLKPEEQKNKFYVKGIDVSVGRIGVRYTVTFQTYLPRTRHVFAGSRLALDEAISSARQHGGIIITDLKAYQYKRRLYFAYVTRVIAQRDSGLNFRVIADLPHAIYKETLDIQKKFGRRLVRTSKYTDRKNKTFHAMLFVRRNLKINRPNFRFRSGN